MALVIAVAAYESTFTSRANPFDANTLMIRAGSSQQGTTFMQLKGIGCGYNILIKTGSQDASSAS